VPRLRNSGAIPPFPQYAFMAWCLINHRDFRFTFVVRHLVCLGHIKQINNNNVSLLYARRVTNSDIAASRNRDYRGRSVDEAMGWGVVNWIHLTQDKDHGN
jgi:hypothetical protein